MKSLVPFLHFAGKCEEALAFYKECFNGEITAVQRYSVSPMPISANHKSKILYSLFQADGLTFMASDGPPDYNSTQGDSISLNVEFSDQHEQEMVFNALSKGGTVIMPLKVQFWGANFGMLIDKYGFHWFLSCNNTNH
jgi:PhnB protein